MELYLASSSPARADLLSKLNVPFHILKHSVNEEELMGKYSSSQQMVQELAKAKALSGSSQLSPEARAEAIIIGCDTVNYRSGKIMGKPKNDEEAQKMLEYLLTSADTAYTGICVLEPGMDPSVQAFCAEYRFDNLTQEDIAQYVRSKEPLKHAGGYSPMTKFALTFCTTMKGSFQCIYSLPMELLVPVLRRNELLPSLE